jgi:regulator of sirC expression with transglutaminase-like and TPR domain
MLIELEYAWMYVFMWKYLRVKNLLKTFYAAQNFSPNFSLILPLRLPSMSVLSARRSSASAIAGPLQ